MAVTDDDSCPPAPSCHPLGTVRAKTAEGDPCPRRRSASLIHGLSRTLAMGRVLRSCAGGITCRVCHRGSLNSLGTKGGTSVIILKRSLAGVRPGGVSRASVICAVISKGVMFGKRWG